MSKAKTKTLPKPKYRVGQTVRLEYETYTIGPYIIAQIKGYSEFEGVWKYKVVDEYGSQPTFNETSLHPNRTVKGKPHFDSTRETWKEFVTRCQKEGITL